jgi:hypothetical protein
MSEKVTFAELCQLLENLAFERLVQPTHILFEHPATDTKVLLRPYQQREIVSLPDLAVVRKTLDERGLMSSNSFEHHMRKQSA